MTTSDLNPVTIEALFRLVEQTYTSVNSMAGHMGKLQSETQSIKEHLARQNGTIINVVEDVQELKTFKRMLWGLGLLITIMVPAATAIGIAFFK